MEARTQKVVIVEPGDVLVLGVAGSVEMLNEEHMLKALSSLFNSIGVKVLVIEGEVSVAKVSERTWQALNENANMLEENVVFVEVEKT